MVSEVNVCSCGFNIGTLRSGNGHGDIWETDSKTEAIMTIGGTYQHQANAWWMGAEGSLGTPRRCVEAIPQGQRTGLPLPHMLGWA